MNFSEMQAGVVSWHVARFPDATAERVGLKLTEETGEVASALLHDFGRESATGKGELPAEAADVIISLMVLAGRWYPTVNLLSEVGKKLEILTNPDSGHRAAILRDQHELNT